MSNSKGSDARRILVPALIAAGSGFAVTPAHALELGDIQVRSTLGQPLRASIAYALGPNEELAAYCISTLPPANNSGIPSIHNADVSVANGVIALSGYAAVREPIVSVRLNVRCPYSPKLTREYTLFIDPPLSVQANASTSPAATESGAMTASRPAITTAAVAPASSPVRTAGAKPAAAASAVASNSRYRVQPGDSLSQIAQRIANRPIGLWAAVAEIHALNPDAFIDNDPNKLKAGSWLTIPGFEAEAGVVARFSTVPEIEDTAVSANTEPAAVAASPATAGNAYKVGSDTSVSYSAAAQLPALEPGDIVQDDSALPSSAEALPVPASSGLTDGLKETKLEATIRSESPNVPVARIVAPDRTQTEHGTGLWWLIGGGIALLGGLLVFGRRRDNYYASAPDAPTMNQPMRRASDTGILPTLVDDGFDIPDDAPTSENPALSAELKVEPALGRGTDIIVDEDFSYAANSPLDLELPDESDTQSNTPDTDIIAPPKIDTSSILEREVLPQDDDYDMSVLMDVTKAAATDDVTEKDLKAIAIENDETEITDAYTVSQEIDYQVLEQDYEEELSATQALNLEIEKAAAYLVEHRDEYAGDIETSETEVSEATTRLPLASVTALDTIARTADDIDDTEDTGVLDELDLEDTLNDELTAELKPSNDDATVEMTIDTDSTTARISRIGKV